MGLFLGELREALLGIRPLGPWAQGPNIGLPGPSWEAHMAIVNPLNMGAYKGIWPQNGAQKGPIWASQRASGRPILGLFWGPGWEASWEGLGGSKGRSKGNAHIASQKGSKGPLEGPQNRAYFGGPFGPILEALLNSIMKESLENRHQTAQGLYGPGPWEGPK